MVLQMTLVTSATSVMMQLEFELLGVTAASTDQCAYPRAGGWYNYNFLDTELLLLVQTDGS